MSSLFTTGQTIHVGALKSTGKGTCDGGAKPHPPLHDYPLLAWIHAHGHPVHGKSVFTEDGRASVADIALAIVETPDVAAVAAKFNTTDGHIRQAIAYAVAAGVIE